MSRLLLIIFSALTLGLSSCDTTSNVKPRNEDYFIKFYGGVNAGNQFANDIIATSDGGLLIAGTSENNDGTKELILIKTDAKGTQEWIYGAGQDLGILKSQGKSVIEIPNVGYVVGGITNDGINPERSVLIKVDFNGNKLIDPLKIITKDTIANIEHANRLSKITNGHSGILVSGETDHPSGGAGLNGFIGLVDEQLLTPIAVPPNSSLFIHYFGSDSEDKVTGAYEIVDTINSITTGIGRDASRFLIFGSTDVKTTGEFDFYYAGFTKSFGPSPGIGVSTIVRGWDGSNEFSNYLTRLDDTYLMIGEFNNSNSQIFLVGWNINPTYPPAPPSPDWKTIPGSGRISPSDNVIGKGLSIQNPSRINLVGDVKFSIDHTEIFLAGMGKNLSINSPWPKIYGATASTYSASAVTTLADGSIVVAGTADLQPIKKIIVIKTGPDGQMSF